MREAIEELMEEVSESRKITYAKQCECTLKGERHKAIYAMGCYDTLGVVYRHLEEVLAEHETGDTRDTPKPE